MTAAEKLERCRRAEQRACQASDRIAANYDRYPGRITVADVRRADERAMRAIAARVNAETARDIERGKA